MLFYCFLRFVRIILILLFLLCSFRLLGNLPSRFLGSICRDFFGVTLGHICRVTAAAAVVKLVLFCCYFLCFLLSFITQHIYTARLSGVKRYSLSILYFSRTCFQKYRGDLTLNTLKPTLFIIICILIHNDTLYCGADSEGAECDKFWTEANELGHVCKKNRRFVSVYIYQFMMQLEVHRLKYYSSAAYNRAASTRVCLCLFVCCSCSRMLTIKAYTFKCA